jgi:hypothetical protein
MLCPVCGLDTIEERNGRLYCTHDDIVVGNTKGVPVSPNAAAAQPASPSISSSTQGRLDSLAPVYIKKQHPVRSAILVILAIFIPGYLLFTSLFYFDPAYGCTITIVPSVNLEFNNGIVIEGLRLLKKVSPQDYRNTCARVSTIQTGIGCGGFGGGCHYSNKPREIYVSSQRNDLAWTAAVLVHETCHALQNYEKREMTELECNQEDDRILRSITVYK